jgi:hypothetical protein
MRVVVSDFGKQHRTRRPINANPSSRPGIGSTHTSEKLAGTGTADVDDDDSCVGIIMGFPCSLTNLI